MKNKNLFPKSLCIALFVIALLNTHTTASTFKRSDVQNLGNTPWKFHKIETEKDLNPRTEKTAIKEPAFDDSKWEDVGIPHCYNDKDTYLNTTEEKLWKGEAWYRKHIYVDKKDKGSILTLEFQGVNVGVAVYVNGIFKNGNTKVEQPDEVTHVGGYIPFSVDITDQIKFGEENVIAIRVSNAPNSFFTWPNFGVFASFGMAWGGIVSPVYLHKTPKVYIPLNDYAASGKWGTYQDAVYANEKEAKLSFQTTIENKEITPQKVELRTEIYDNKGLKVLSLSDKQTIQGQKSGLFRQNGLLQNPQLWYPNASPYGKPTLYRIVRTILIKGKQTYSQEQKMGIRQITWDDNYCYINGKKHLIKGFGYRNIYPALGSAVPAELQWKDVALIADCGGNSLRVGHLPPSSTMLEACDEYGIMVLLNSGDNEWSLTDEPAISYKKEYDRNAIIAFRNHPSVIAWESNNGLAYKGTIYTPGQTQELVDQWDSIQPRIVVNRDGYPKGWNPDKKIVVGYTNRYEKVNGSPTLNEEVYGANWEGRACWNIARFDYENEKKFSEWYVNDYLSNIRDRACGWIDWMLTETQGEGYTIYLNGRKNQKSLGSSALDANRFPKLKYRIYEKALWIPFEMRPGVALQSQWNLSGVQDVDAWSNCPYVELFINDKSWGIRQPNPETKQCTWENLVWQSGKMRAIGLNTNKEKVCMDSIESSGAPNSIVVEVEKPVTTPSGKVFSRRANGSDVTIITCRIVDKEGRWCPNADNNITFTVEGEGTYCGSSDFYITDNKPEHYHAPFDKELQAEGGLIRIAVRSTFKTGKVIVKASSPSLDSGSTSYFIQDGLSDK